ncbi:MAG: M48 family metalloprotease [Deltaproteobacteria bacterium]|nr:M48 family metalloprotease [Deltaproteobacteria bacterium]
MKPFLTRLTALLLFTQAFLFLPFAWAIEINADGQALIQQASQAYSADLRNRPIVMDPDVVAYTKKIARRLVPKHKQPPAGVSICLTVIDSPKPELYSYVDGHMIMTTGVLYAMNNEAQLAGVMAHEVAQLVEGYYISMYQEIKAAERRQHTKAAAGALFGAMLDVAVDYTVEVQEIRMTDRLFSGENTYKETMEKMAAVHAARGAYSSISDVIDSVPSVDDSGQRVDPRQRFEPVADAQGMEYMALAGYDVEAAVGWENIHRVSNALAREQALAMGAFAQQMQAMQTVSKQVFTLEDVSKGLAYFSVRERSLTKSTAPGGGKTDTKTAGKGEAIFDLREGMWVEMTTKSRIKVKLGNIPGMGAGNSEMLNIHKITMEKE